MTLESSVIENSSALAEAKSTTASETLPTAGTPAQLGRQQQRGATTTDA